MTSSQRVRVAPLFAVLAAGAGLFGAAVGGMAAMDSRLAAAVGPEVTTRFAGDRPGGPGAWDCPEPRRDAPARAWPEV